MKKERPILFSGPMVRALLDRSKTQTRRVVKLPHNNPLGQWEPTSIGGANGGRTAAGETVPLQGGIWHTRTGDSLMCPHGQPGDRLWVRETLAPTRDQNGYIVDWHYAADSSKVPRDPNLSPMFNDAMAFAHLARMSVPSIHMPRWASRIKLEVTGVRVERLQVISEADAIAEGIGKTPSGFWSTYGRSGVDGTYSPRSSFHCLWDSINGPESWDASPWVWVVEFRRV
ncbi:hypothetical protein [Paraburkholderia sp. DGU8]|uniref:hypothetical protein n=1 Tax=Paraburkholderia sp. DGU8 TaxID=3161997 RepID=UPI0034650530